MGIGEDGYKVFVAGCDSTLHILDATSGETAAEIPLGGNWNDPFISGSDAFGTEGGMFFAVNFLQRKSDGKPKETIKPAYRSSATVDDDLVFVGSRGRAVKRSTD